MTDDSDSINEGVRESDDESTSWSLVERAKSGDPVAWRQLIAWITPLMLHWCRKAGMQEADAFDVCQEVAAAISRSLTNYRRTHASFRGWLKVITSRKISDHFRLRQKEPEAMGGSDAHEQLQNLPTPCLSDDADSEAEEENILYRQALNLLQQEFEEKTWRAFWKVVIEGRAPIDVADEIGISTNAVYLARSHILRRLRREFSDIGTPLDNVTRILPPSDAS